jgi:hypothetical protein
MTTIIHDFYCTKCGLRMPLPRKRSLLKETGHLKKLYCLNCKEEVNFVECTDKFTYNDYLQKRKELKENEQG